MLAAVLVLGGTLYVAGAIGALLVAWARPAGAARRVAGRAGLLSLAFLVVGVLALAVPTTGAGDSAADILIWVVFAAFAAGLVLIALAGRPSRGSVSGPTASS